jgi:hypothetical protein
MISLDTYAVSIILLGKKQKEFRDETLFADNPSPYKAG